MAEYKLHFDEALLIQGMERRRALGSLRFLRRFLKLVGFVGLGGLLLLSIYLQGWILVGIFLCLIGLLLVGPRADYWIYRSRYRKSPLYGTTVAFTLTPSGYSSHSELLRAEVSWHMFTKARRMSDGFLMFSGSQSYLWWPDSAISTGDSREVESLLRDHVSDFAVT